jgi:hypothetical protein
MIHINIYFVVGFISGAYFLWVGVVLLSGPERIRRDPLWRLSWAVMPIRRELDLRFAKPLGAIAMAAGALLLIESALVFLGY